jgi:hypothetical protein
LFNILYSNQLNIGKTVRYKLADGSMSTDYKIGDKFTHRNGDSAIFTRDDGEENPWFTTNSGQLAISWCFLTPVNTKNHASTIDQLRSTIQYLERTIEELER